MTDMNSTKLHNAITQQIAIRSGLDQHRNYLGISKIGDCPRHAVLEYLHGVRLTEDAHRMCFAGYEQEASVIELLAQIKLAYASGQEVIAPFDSRFRGHIHALTVDGDLVEIKSVSVDKYQKVLIDRQVLRKHYMQVQLYMRYGGWQRTHIIYRCRETYEHIVICVPYAESKAEKYEQKAKMMLSFIDRKEIPPCECGRCK
jgi:hypothetical protein